MKVLITGGTGIVGWDLVRESISRGYETTYTFHENEINRADASARHLDIRDKEQVQKLIDEVDPKVTIHSAALVNADHCEREPELAWNINVSGTRHVAQACDLAESQMVFLSSSFVFSGDKERYFAGDDRDPINFYGETKVAAEDIASKVVDSTIIRTDQPYTIPESWQSETMISWTLSQLENNTIIDVFDDWYNRPIFVCDLSRLIFNLIDGGATGVYHGVGPEFISRYQWAKKIASAFDKSSSRIRPSSAEDTGLSADRPNANLSNEKILNVAEAEIRTIDDALNNLKN